MIFWIPLMCVDSFLAFQLLITYHWSLSHLGVPYFMISSSVKILDCWRKIGKFAVNVPWIYLRAIPWNKTKSFSVDKNEMHFWKACGFLFLTQVKLKRPSFEWMLFVLWVIQSNTVYAAVIFFSMKVILSSPLVKF